ncbi:MAG: hypothetical protein AAFQ06_00525 [Pseudomonadota bacterium]
MILPLCIVALCPGPLAAEGQAPIALDLAALLALAESPWRSEDSFLDVLHETVPNFAERRGGSRLTVPHNDPFLYNISGHFAQPPTPHLPGGVLSCTRYGLETRDLFVSEGFTSPSAFALYQEARPAPDDADVWPETAIARLACSFVWDDSRSVEIIARGPAEVSLRTAFERLSDLGDETAQTYHLVGHGGREDTSMLVESAEIVLTPSYQLLSFRAFLLNGGM